MNTLAILSIIVGVMAFAAVYINNTTAGGTPIVLTPPYHYEAAGDFPSELNAFFFAFIFSVLFFGLSGPIALAIEGAKYAGLYTTGALAPFDFAFLIPQVLAVFSATLLGQAIVSDYMEKKSFLEGWTPARNYFLIAIALFAAIYLARTLVLNIFATPG